MRRAGDEPSTASGRSCRRCRVCPNGGRTPVPGMGRRRRSPRSTPQRASSSASRTSAAGRGSFSTSSRTSTPVPPEDLDVHIVMDKDRTHKTASVKAWPARRSRDYAHFTATSASWIDQAERRFAEPARKRLQRGARTSTNRPEADIRALIDRRGRTRNLSNVPKPPTISSHPSNAPVTASTAHYAAKFRLGTLVNHNRLKSLNSFRNGLLICARTRGSAASLPRVPPVFSCECASRIRRRSRKTSRPRHPSP